MNQNAYRKLISGQTTGTEADILRLLLRGLAKGYSAAMSLRNFLYSKKILKSHKVDAAVFSVGNITTGGTGKTPLVIWLCNKITQNYNCAILTRGYKAHTKQASNIKHQVSGIDEPAILTKSCPDAKIIVNSDRVAGATKAITEHNAKVLIMDDGFQHRRLHRDIDIVTIDATCPFGFAQILPAGLMREPIAALKRADVVIITRCDQISITELQQLEQKLKLKQKNPQLIIAKTIHDPICARSMNREELGIDQLKDKKIFAFCGIGNPNAFLATARKLGGYLAGSKIYNDHYHYTKTDVADIYEQAKASNADLILTTQKDWTKTTLFFEHIIKRQNSQQTAEREDLLFAYLAIEVKFLTGEDELITLIEQVLEGKISGN